MITKKEFKKITLLFIIWRLFLFAVASIAPYLLTYKPSFPYAFQLAQYGLPQWLYSWANFDGVHYLTIINKGYFGTGLIQAFFPLFPISINLVNITGNSLAIGLLVSTFFSFLLIITFYSFIKRFTTDNYFFTLLIFLMFPTSFFLGAFYTESLFLLLVLQTFIQADKKNWLMAGLLAALASGTRIVGILLVPALFLEYFFENKKITQLFSMMRNRKGRNTLWSHIAEKMKRKNSKVIAFISFGMTGLIAYMIYLWIRFGDPIYFFHVQSEFGGGRQESLIMYPQVVFRYIKILLTARPIDFKYFAYVQEFIAGTVGLLLLLVSSSKIKISHLFFVLGAFFIPTLTGTFSSMPRYILICWPLFFVIAETIKNRPFLKYLYIIVSLGLLIVNTLLFIQGYWVA